MVVQKSPHSSRGSQIMLSSSSSAHMWATGYNPIACFAPENAASVPILYVLAMKGNVKLH